MVKKQKVALVLSGGGARGIAHIGVIQELERQGYEISSVAGTSMGSLVGGVYACGKLDEFAEWGMNLDKLQIFSMVDFSFSRQGMLKGDKIFKKLKDFLPIEKIEDLHLPFAAVAAELIHKKEVVFTEGDLYTAIRASISIPSVFTPVKLDNGLLVDGGTINNIPINRVERNEGDILIVVNVNADVPVDRPAIPAKQREERLAKYRDRLKDFHENLWGLGQYKDETKMGYFNLITKTLDLVTWRIDELTLMDYSPEVLINISRDCEAIYDFYKVEELIEIGRHVARKSLIAYSEGSSEKSSEGSSEK